jgi:hypothetical protein
LTGPSFSGEGEVIVLKKVTVAAVLVLLLAFAARADHPLNGVYLSATGQVLVGRFSESYVGGEQGMMGNTVHAESWDGAILGTQWEVFCPALAEPPELIDDTVDEFGNGHRVYRSIYTGGSFELEGSGDWGNGDAWYYGDLFFYVHTTTMQIVGGELEGYTTNAQLSGTFTGYDNCMQLTIANAVLVGMDGIPPADYPSLRMQEYDEGQWCADPLPDVVGEWGNVWSITMVISDCGTPSEGKTWGTMKNLYR